MTPADDAAPTREDHRVVHVAYPFAAFALQATLGVRLGPPSPPERSGSA